ncbi:MAG TPA: glycosyltransferase family 9 protein [Burkholderiales bacterium]|nr:glycosyltransferase family 9 protein [Burkholderiales bacterium]
MRIAVVRALQLGDLLCAVPAIRALRATDPETSLTLIGLPWARELAARFGRYFDDFIEFPGFPGLPERACDTAALPAFFERVNRMKFHIVVQMHGDGRLMNPLAALMGGQVTGGYYRPGRYRPDPEGFIEWRDDEHEVHRWLRLVEHLGAPSRGTHLEFPLAEPDWRELEALHLSELRYAVVHPGSQLPSRRWPVERFAEVGDALAQDGFHVVLTGTLREEPLVRRVQEAMREPAIDLSGRTSLGGLAAVVSRARLVVCNDTGISHIAAAMRTPSVVIASGSDPKRWAPLNRELHRVLWHDVPCRPCAYAECPTGHECAVGVTVHDVLHAVRRLEECAA